MTSESRRQENDTAHADRDHPGGADRAAERKDGERDDDRDGDRDDGGDDGRDDDRDGEDIDEDEHAVDDAFRAMLEGIRTTLPGSQVLLAFLLTVPLQAGFSELGDDGRAAFLVALLGAALASVLLIAPTAHARVRFPTHGLRRRTMSHLRVAAWLALAGTIALAFAIGAAVYLSVTLLLEPTWAGLLAAGVGLVTVVTWFAIPIWWTLRGE